MQPYIEEKGAGIVSDEVLLKDPVTFTANILKFKAVMNGIVSNSFDNNNDFQKCRDKSF